MAGIFTRPALDKIMQNADLTPEQRTEQVFSLYGRALDEGYISKSAAEDAKQAAVEAAKAGIKIPDPVDPKTTPEYMEVVKERDMLRAIGGDDFQAVKPKFRETVFGMLDRGEKAASIQEQLTGIKEKYEEYFVPEKEPEQPKKTPQFSQQPGHPGTNPESEEDKLVKQLSDNW
ncbi:MAG: hypothetical protein IIZ93_01495 [Acidaminococcaceae bacterium]|nr:hypothetical protein [Acidaminococcaceae bacterium]